IGYVRLSNFARNTASDLTQVVRTLKRQGMRALVLDLRFNPGGLLNSARTISDLFIKDGPIVSIRRPRKGQEARMRGRAGNSGEEDDTWGVTPDKGYVLALSRKQRDDLAEHLRNTEIIPRRDQQAPVKEKTEFKDRQLEMALKYLRNEVASR